MKLKREKDGKKEKEQEIIDIHRLGEIRKGTEERMDVAQM
jgi:hypothetical protein